MHRTPTQPGAVARRTIACACLLLGLSAPPALAVDSKEKVCDEVARKSERAIWNSVRETGDELFCRKPWVDRRPEELLACGLHVESNRFANRLKNHWNRFFQQTGAEWGTWGPRGLGPEWEEGTIRGFRRVFFGAGLAYSTSKIEVVKEGGRAEANITVCELDDEGNVQAAHRRTFASGQGGEQRPQNVVLGVVVDTPASVNSFEYRMRIQSEPTKVSEAQAPGIADLHVHQLVNLAFGGRMYWGQHDGPRETALAPEQITGHYDPTAGVLNPGELLRRLDDRGLDANVLLRAFSPEMTDEGTFNLGGGGYPRFQNSPDHADRSRQQVYIEWLREAHEIPEPIASFGRHSRARPKRPRSQAPRTAEGPETSRILDRRIASLTNPRVHPYSSACRKRAFEIPIPSTEGAQDESRISVHDSAVRPSRRGRLPKP